MSLFLNVSFHSFVVINITTTSELNDSDTSIMYKTCTHPQHIDRICSSWLMRLLIDLSKLATLMTIRHVTR